MLEEQGFKPPGFKKTGTTIVGVVFKVCFFFFSLSLGCAVVMPSFCRMELFWVQILVPQEGQLCVIKTAKKSITLLITSGAVALEQQLIQNILQS